MPNHEPLALAVGMIFAVVLVEWLRQATRRRWLALVALAVIAAWSMWGAAMLVGILLLAGIVQGSRKQQRELVMVGVIMTGAVVLLLIYYELAVPGAFEELLRSFSVRSGDTIGYGTIRAFSWIEFAVQQVIDLMLNLTPGVLLVGIIGLFITMRTQSRQTKIIALALWGMAVIYILILHNAAYEHDFYKFFFVPPVALTGAVAVEQAWQSRRWRPVMMAVLVTSLTGGWLYTGYLHHIARDPRQPAILQSIQTIAQPEEKLVTGASTASLGMFYYLNRPLTLNVSPEQALERRKTETDPMLYIYCPVDKLPENLKSYTFTVDEYCAYILLPAED